MPSSSLAITSRERINRIFNFQAPDRVGIYDCLWEGTVKKWKKENKLPAAQGYQDYFDFDMRLFGFDQSFLLDEKQIEEDAASRTLTDSFGVTRKILKDTEGAGQILEAAVYDRRTWDNFKGLLQPLDSRITEAAGFKKAYEAAYSAGKFTVFSFLGPFQQAVSVFGMEETLKALKKDARLAADVFSVSAQLTMDMCDMLRRRGIVFDGAWFWEDMAYKNSVLFSPDIYRNLLFGEHRKLCRWFESRRMHTILHCDGDMRQILPQVLDAGIKAVTPLETGCGFDIAELKKEYSGRLVIFGNMPTDVLVKDKELIEDTLSRRLEIAKRGSGFIYHGDKPVPPEVEFEKYEFALEVVKNYGRY